MKIGIIGVGNIGSTLARKLAAAGHQVRVANSKGADDVREFADEIGATAADTRGAIAGADLVVLTIPFPSIEKLPKGLFAEASEALIVVDTGNYYPGLRDPNISAIDAGQVESEWVAEKIGRPVIKAFNNILADSLAKLSRETGAPGRLAVAVAVAGDDEAAKQVVMGLVDQIGFDPVDGGVLAQSWRQQPSTPAYCCDFDAESTKQGLAAANKDATPQRRDALIAHLQSLEAYPEHDELVRLNRRFNAAD